jgi:hypothetical protein
MQTGSNDGKVYVWREPDEEYNEDCIEPTFIPEFKRVKVWGAIRYGKKSKLVVIPENIENGKKLDAETYMTKIMDKELFDFWQEAMEDSGQVYVMEDEAPPHQGIAVARRRQLEEVGWCNTMGPGTQETPCISNKISAEYLTAVAYVQLDHMGYTKIVRTLR